MSFPNIVYGSSGDQFTTSSTKIGSLPLGTEMVIPGGRWFVHARASATALVAGKLYQQNIGIQGTDTAYIKDLAVAANAAIGAQTVQVTCGATTAVTKNQFTDGFLFVNDATGEGYSYMIKENTAAAAGSTCTLTLYENETIQVALAAGISEVGIRENPYYSLTLTTADTVTVGPVAGIAPVAVAANYYCWIQTDGVAAAFTDGTLIVGEPVVAGTAAAGSLTVFSPAAADTTGARVIKETTVLGYCLNVAASTEYSLVKLAIPK